MKKVTKKLLLISTYLIISGPACAVYLISSDIAKIEPSGTASDRPIETVHEQNDTSLMGGDRDGDGIRDDVERFIYEKYKSDRNLRIKSYRLAWVMGYLNKEYSLSGKISPYWYGNYKSAVEAIVDYGNSSGGDGVRIVEELMSEINNQFNRVYLFLDAMESAPAIASK